jgi:two-component system phosphate regulon sensor histidine kinase PhoR
MIYFAFALLLAATAFAFKRQRDQRLAIRDLADAVENRRPFLQDENQKALGADWGRLCAAASAAAAELGKLQSARSGQLLQLETTLGSLKEAVLLVDDRDYIVLANAAFQAIFPRARKIVGRRLDLVLPTPAFLEYAAAVRSGGGDARREIALHDGSEPVWVEATAARIPALEGGNGTWAIFVLHDITRQRRLENQRRDFVANVSHELRTPLSVIKGYVETLVDGQDTMDPGDRARFLATIQRHTDRLNAILEDLLTLSRLESDTPDIQVESMDLSALAVEVVDGMRARTGAGNHVIELALVPDCPRVAADAGRIAQVLGNLLDNALKYTPAGSRVRVASRVDGSNVELSVEDNGPGIPSKDLPHVFERFYRVEKGRSRETGGTGLGLSIVKHIVQLHGGRVWAEPVPGGGVAFRISLPAVAPAPARATP